ncbi:MAG: M56 family metallopeptidase [Phycisphaerae bacterium]|nr:M56 family metallopeptidase [Phycisphaerae bacterium]
MNTVINAFEHAGQALVTRALWMNAWCLLLFGGAILLDHLLARRVAASWRICLYLAVLVRLVLPVDWTSPLAALAGAAPAPITAIPAGGAPLPLEFVLSAAQHPGASAPVPIDPAPTLGAWWALAPVLYGVGIVALAAVWWIQHRSIARRLADARPAPESLRIVSRGAPVMLHGSLGPALFGLVRPRIVLPHALVNGLTPAQAAWIVRHESAHERRGDHVLAAILRAVCIVAWPVLGVWLAAARARALMEQAADEWALREASESDRSEYGRTLVHAAAQLARGPVRLLPAAAPAFEHHLAARVRSLRSRPRLARVAQAPLGIVLAAALLSCASARPSPVAVRASDDARAAASSAPATVTFRVFDTLPDHPKLRFAARPKSGPGVPVLKDVPIIENDFQNASSPISDPDHLLSPDELADLLDRASKSGAGTNLTAPRVRLLPDQPARIKIESDRDSDGISLYVRFSPDPHDPMRAAVRLAYDERKSGADAGRAPATTYWMPYRYTLALGAWRDADASGPPARIILVTIESPTAPNQTLAPPNPQMALGPSIAQTEQHAAPPTGNEFLDSLEYPVVFSTAMVGSMPALSPQARAELGAVQGLRWLSAGTIGGEARVWDVRPSGEVIQPLPDAWVGAVPANEIRRVFDTLYRHGLAHESSPALLSNPGQWAEIRVTDTDKPGDPVGVNLSMLVSASPGGMFLVAQCADAGGRTFASIDGVTLGSDETLVLITPGPRARVLCLTPRWIATPEEYPLQTFQGSSGPNPE